MIITFFSAISFSLLAHGFMFANNLSFHDDIEQLFKIGQTVQHSRFGQGVIMQLHGQGTDATARVYFSDHGEKTLALGVAKLEIIK